MTRTAAAARITIGSEVFGACLRDDLAPHSCERLQRLLPYMGEIVHARWSGEAVWSPLSDAWPVGEHLISESATGSPAPGDVLLYAGAESEPELLVVYGPCRFACQAGPLKGNPVLAIEEDRARLAAIGRRILLHGAMTLRIEALAPNRAAIPPINPSVEH